MGALLELVSLAALVAGASLIAGAGAGLVVFGVCGLWLSASLASRKVTR